MALSNWLELGALLLTLAAGVTVWLLLRRKLRSYDGFEGIIEERGKMPVRSKMDIDEEIRQLEKILKRKK